MKKFTFLIAAVFIMASTAIAQQVEIVGVGINGDDTETLFIDGTDFVAADLFAVWLGTTDASGLTFNLSDENENYDVLFNDVDVFQSNWNNNGNPFGFGYFQKEFIDIDPSGVTIDLTGYGNWAYGFYAFVERNIPDANYFSVTDNTHVFYYHNFNQDEDYTYELTLPPSENSRNLTISIPFSGIDSHDDNRIAIIDVDAGGVTESLTLSENSGEPFFHLQTIELVGVPASDTDITVFITITSPLDPEGDSFTTGGVVMDVYPNEECDECEGQITELELEYQGTETGEITVFQKKKKDWVEIYRGTPGPGVPFSFTGVANHNKMGAKIYLYIDGENKTEIHTSCSQDIYAGQTWGDYLIVSGESHEGGPLCYMPDDDEEECDECEGQITELELEYLGTETGEITVFQKKKKDWVEIYKGTPNPGETFSFTGLSKHNKMGAKIFLYVDGENKTEIHTSCSQDIYAGQTWGDYLIISGESHKGGPLCYMPEEEEEEEEECGECEGQITTLDIQFTGNETGTVKVYEGKVKEDKLFATIPNVYNGYEFTLVGSKNHGKMGAKILLTINDGDAVEIHTSCSQDIYAGMEFGDRYYIVAGESYEGGPLCEYDPDKSAAVQINSEAAGLIIYPNPVSHYGNIDFVAEQDANTTVEIYNLVGSRVDILFNDYVKAGSKTSLNFNANKYPKGMYILYIRNGSSVYKEKISVVK